MRHRAITLIEVLVVLSVVVTLGALIYVVSRPAKESARQSTCMANLKQLYTAAMIYDADNPSSDQMSVSLGFNARPFTSGLLMRQLAKDRELFFCPDTPACAKKKIASTYVWPLLCPLEPMNATEEQRLQFVNNYVEANKGKVAILTCFIHQEMFFDPRRNVSEEMEDPFVIQLFSDGHAEGGRKPIRRQRVLEGLCQ